MLEEGTVRKAIQFMKPFLKWAGGKRWLFTDEFVQSLPRFNRYFEPFLGGGAGLFAVRPSQGVVSDVNHELIELYHVVRDNPAQLTSLLQYHQSAHSKQHYYATRETIPHDCIERAARFLYLNRTCWNGLYRLNRNGLFNVPIGTKTRVSLDTDDFKLASEILKNVDIICTDFEATIQRSTQGDLLFVDPPYTVAHNMNGFVKYNEKIFSWEDQLRLHGALKAAIERGAYVIMTNADHASIHDLYGDFPEGKSAKRQSVISGKNKGRNKITEYLMRAACTG